MWFAHQGVDNCRGDRADADETHAQRTLLIGALCPTAHWIRDHVGLSRIACHHTFDTPMALATLRLRDGVPMLVAGTLTRPHAREAGV